MKVGVPKEIKNHEYRVGVIPAGVHALIERKYEVVVQSGAGEVTHQGFAEDVNRPFRAYADIAGQAADHNRSTSATSCCS